MSIEAMKQALEALKNHLTHHEHGCVYLDPAVTALRQAIEQAEQAQPEAWSTRERFYQALNEAVETTKERMFIRTVTMRCKDYDIALPVINIRDGHVVVGQGFTPPQRQPLHDMAVFDLADTHLYEGGKNYGVLAFARAIEAAHGIKGEA
jgi:arsenate reductase-like glutaredoxin family protein